MFLDCSIARIIAYCLIGVGVPIFLILLFLPAWYGRYTSNIHYYFGSLPAKVAWILQECPSFLIPFICITFPAQLILVELTILFPFIEIASAPAIFNSFIIATKLPS